MHSELSPCPFCDDAGNDGMKEAVTTIHENHHSPTMDGKVREPISVDIKHWCSNRGLPRLLISITGKTREEAISLWNTRATKRESLSLSLKETAFIVDSLRQGIDIKSDWEVRLCGKLNDHARALFKIEDGG